MGIASDISSKNQRKKKDIAKKETNLKGENFEININNVPKYSDDPFVFDHHDDKEDDESEENEGQEEKVEAKEYFGNEKPHKGNPMTKWVVILIIILVTLIVYQNYSYILSFFNISDNQTDDSLEMESPYDNDYATETQTQEEVDNSTPEESTSDQPINDTSATTTAIDRSALKISVLNGNGISGSAKTVKVDLETAGYSVLNVGNALKFSYANTAIYYNTDKIVEAEELKDVLSNRTCDLHENSGVAGNYDIVVVVGTN